MSKFQPTISGSSLCSNCGWHRTRHTKSGPRERVVCPERYSFIEVPLPSRFNPPPADQASISRAPALKGYESLARVLDQALNHAQAGKGKERHAGPGEAFEDQKIVQLCVWMGGIQGDVFQACKKALEAVRLEPDKAKHELLGAINYLAAAVIVLDELAPKKLL